MRRLPSVAIIDGMPIAAMGGFLFCGLKTSDSLRALRALGGPLMTPDDVPANPDQTVLIELLDPTFEKPVKSWSFAGRTSITIGRADDQDVEVPNLYVSRTHAKLSFRDGRWMLESLGRNGVLVENKLVTNFPLECGCKFRLGSGGPFLRMQTAGKKFEGTHTMLFDTFPEPLFALDEAKLQHEVTQIAGGDYFQNLQEKARLLRLRRSSNSN